MKHRQLVSLLVVTFLAQACWVSAYNNGVGARPPMGWNTWCTDDICGLIDICTESEVKSVAKAMVSEGMHELGYEYINLDDCWSDKERDANGHLQPVAAQFPSGMKALADYIHSLGLKLGVYTCVGTKTCRGGRPGSFGHFHDDAQTLAGWGVDFVKADYCSHPSGYTPQELYGNFSRALNATGRPILFSLCEWGEGKVQEWGAEVGQMYRIQMDHLPLWNSPPWAAGTGYGQGTYNIIEYIATLKPSTFVKQYGWMDPDFLETLFPITMPFIDSRTEYSFWSLWSAPLLVSTDIRKMSSEKKSILMNPEVIAIDQDQLSTAGDRLHNSTDGGQVWARPLHNGDTAVLLFNGHDTATINVTVTWEMLGWPADQQVLLRDLWKRADIGNATRLFTANLAPHDVMFLRAS